MKAGSHSWWFLTVWACAALSPFALGATTLRVGSGETDLTTLQAAVDAAVDDDVIILSPGTYTGPGNCDIDLRGKAITIQSTDPLDADIVAQTVIDCAGSEAEPHRAFYIVDCNGVGLAGLTITHGLATAGGAIYCDRSTLELAHCRIVDNAALPGGTAYSDGGPGGGLYCERSTVTVLQSLIGGNAAGSGAPATDGEAGPGGSGGGICSVKSQIHVVSSTISHNVAGNGGASEQADGGNGGDGGGICSDAVHATDSVFSFNVAGAGGSGLSCGRGGRGGGAFVDLGEMDRCTVEGNRAGDSDQAVSGAEDGHNAGAGDGGGVYSGTLEIANSLIVGNRAGRAYAADASGWVDHGDGGGLWCAAGTVRNCTIAENAVCRSEADPNAGLVSSAGRGAGMFMTARVTLTDSIIYDNSPDELAGFDDGSITYCNLGGAVPAKPDSNDFEDPVFVRPGSWVDAKGQGTAAPDDPNAVWVRGDYHLRATSPALDAGDPNYVPPADETDLDGKPRLADAAVDLGAYESAAFTAVYRFWSPLTGDHFYTVGEPEKDKLITRYANAWTFEGIAYYAYARATEPNLVPVYRLWSDTLGLHFFTTQESERAELLKQDPPVWVSEGKAFYVYPDGRQPAGTKPVYRLWSDALGAYFYTMSETEKDELVNAKPSAWTLVDIAWYAYEAPKTDDSAELPKTDDSAEAPKTDDAAEAPKTDDSSEAPKTDDSAEAPKTDDSSGMLKTDDASGTPKT
jgi:hypothetical protein